MTSQCGMLRPVSPARDTKPLLADRSATNLFFVLSVGLRQLCSGCRHWPFAGVLTLMNTKQSLAPVFTIASN